MLKIHTARTHRGRRELDRRAPKLVENDKKTLLLHGKKTNSVLNQLLTEIHILKKSDSIKYTRKNDNVRPFEAGGETSLEFFAQKTDCGLFVFASDSKKRPNNLVMGRFYDNHIYDMVEVGVENFKSLQAFSYDKKFAPKMGSKPLVAFIGEGFENNEELRHLKEVLLDLLRGEVIDKMNLAGVDRVYVCTAISDKKVFLTHCGLRLKKSGTSVPKIELIEVGPSMDLVVRRHRLPNEGLRKEAMKAAPDSTKKKVKNIKGDALLGKLGKIYMPDQKIGEKSLPFLAKGMKRERREGKTNKNVNVNADVDKDERSSKKQKSDST